MNNTHSSHISQVRILSMLHSVQNLPVLRSSLKKIEKYPFIKRFVVLYKCYFFVVVCTEKSYKLQYVNILSYEIIQETFNSKWSEEEFTVIKVQDSYPNIQSEMHWQECQRWLIFRTNWCCQTQSYKKEYRCNRCC